MFNGWYRSFTVWPFCATIIVASMLACAPRSAAQGPELVLQTGHSKFVEDVAWSADGRWLISASFDGSIKVWDADSGQELRSLQAHVGPVKSVAISPDSETIASTGSDGTLRIWNSVSGAQIGRVQLGAARFTDLNFSPNGRDLLASGPGSLIVNFDSKSLEEKLRVPDSQSSVLDFSHDGRKFAFGGHDGTVSIQEVATGRSLSKRKTGRPVSKLKVSPSGKSIFVAAPDGTAVVLDLDKGTRIASMAGIGNQILSLGFESEYSVVIVYEDGSVSRLQLNPGSGSENIYKKSDTSVTARCAAISASGLIAAFGNGDGTLSLVDLKKGQQIRTLTNHTNGIYGVAVSRDRRWLAGAGFDNSIKFWDLSTGDAVGSFTGHTGRVRDVEFLPDSNSLVSASSDNTIRIWNALTRRTTSVLSGHTASVSTIAVGRIGKVIVSGSLDRRVGIWDADNKRPPRFLGGHTGEVTAVALSEDENMAVSVSTDGFIKLWDTGTGRSKGSIDAAAGELFAVAMSPDAAQIAAGGLDGNIRVFSTNSMTLIRTFTGTGGRINAVKFGSDGKSLISAGQDRIIRTWNVVDGTPTSGMTGHSGSIYSLDLSVAGNWLFSASEDGTIGIWSTASKVRAATLVTIKESDDWIAVTPTGFFDGSPVAWRNLSWRFGGNTFDVRPIEVFFNEYYVPGLVADVLGGKPMPAATDISQKDRRQPVVEIEHLAAKSDGVASVRLKISKPPAGAKDVRLFRNGSLVKAWRGDVMGSRDEVVLETDVRTVAGVNQFTSYAFNRDDVKSSDAVGTLTVPLYQRPKPVAHILAIGVNSYANPDYDLNQAVNDARDFADELQKHRPKTTGETVETRVLFDKDATKANVAKAIADIAAAARPEDSVTIFFAGHGIAVDERFYLIPHDLGFDGSRSSQTDTDLAKILTHSISDDELDRAVEPIDARSILLVIDACNSGQILDSNEKRRGPMNSKGLAQLAYEKGMYILTASQSFQAAKEDARLGHGYLTYALIEDGLRNGSADRSPKDGNILLREWLNFASDRVPEIDEEEIGKVEKRARKLEREKGKALAIGNDGSIQRPRVFYRREPEAEPFIIAKTGN